MRQITISGKNYKITGDIIKRAINPWKASLGSEGGREFSDFGQAELEEYHNSNDVVVTTSSSSFLTGNTGMLHGIVKTDIQPGTWQLRFAAETTGTITVKAGSTLRYRKVA